MTEKVDNFACGDVSAEVSGIALEKTREDLDSIDELRITETEKDRGDAPGPGEEEIKEIPEPFPPPNSSREIDFVDKGSSDHKGHDSGERIQSVENTFQDVKHGVSNVEESVGIVTAESGNEENESEVNDSEDTESSEEESESEGESNRSSQPEVEEEEVSARSPTSAQVTSFVHHVLAAAISTETEPVVAAPQETIAEDATSALIDDIRTRNEVTRSDLTREELARNEDKVALVTRLQVQVCEMRSELDQVQEEHGEALVQLGRDQEDCREHIDNIHAAVQHASTATKQLSLLKPRLSRLEERVAKAEKSRTCTIL